MAGDDSRRLKQELLVEEEGSEDERLSIDSILSKYVGEFGVAQLLHFVLANLVMVLAAMDILVIIFAHRQPLWRCKNPADLRCMGASSTCGIDPAAWEWSDAKESSVVSEWGLVCSQAYKVGLVGSTFFLGGILGSGVFGNLSDKHLGRKGALTVSCIVLAATGGLTAMAPNFWIYLLLRGLTGLGYGGVILSSFVLSTEVIGPSKRGVAGMCAFYFFSLGTVALSGLAYISSSSWRRLYATISALSILYCLVVLPCLPESPRWYAVHGEFDKSLDVLRSFARRNGRTSIPSGVKVALDGGSNEASSGTLADVFRHRSLRKQMLIVMTTWFSGFIMFYGISLNVVNLRVNLYITVIVNGLSETPAYAISAFFIGRMGRRRMLFLCLIASGTSCLIGSLIGILFSRDSGLLRISQVVCGALGIFGVGATYNLFFIYTAELFPTEVRNAALGLANQAGQIGAVAAPLVVILAQYHASIPFAVIGVLGIMASLICLMLPETLNQPIWETIEGMTKAGTCNA